MEGLSIWVSLQLLLITAAGLISVMHRVIRTEQRLNLQKFCLLAAVLCAFSSPLIPDNHHVEVWAKTDATDTKPVVTVKLMQADATSFSTLIAPSTAEAAAGGFSLLILLLSLVGGLGLLVSYLKLWRLQNSCTPLRRIGRVQILVLPPQNRCPLAWRGLHRLYVALPCPSRIGDSAWHLSLRHELQHHRQGDTLFAHLLAALKSLFWFNPALYFITGWIHESQEFLCDARLVGRQTVDTKEYGRCLVEMASHQSALPFWRLGPAGTTGFWRAGGKQSSQIYRRVKSMLSLHSKPATSGSRWHVAATGLLTVGLLGLVAVGSQAAVKDRRVTLDQAKQMVTDFKKRSDFPVEINQQVLEQLNFFAGTEAGRNHMRQALERMPTYLPTIEPHLRFYRMPRELLAVPIIESGYVNRVQDENPWHGAGIWMFIATTARRFGLRVTDEIDDRLDANLESDAAMRYLGTNFLRFKDWRLSLISYYAGENRIQEGINSLNTRDPWELTENGYAGPGNYLAKIMAAVLIMENPDLIDN